MKMHAIAAVVLFTGCAVVSSSAAQQPVREPQRPGNATPQRPSEERPRFQMVNVRVELTVTDSAASAEQQKKSVSMIIADGQMGRIRAQRHSENAATLNVDATPVITGDRVRLQVSLEYSPPMTPPNPARHASVTEVVTVILDPGKPTLISQSADPSADRKVTVEVTATVLK